MDKIHKELLEAVAGLHEMPVGAYNIRTNGESTAPELGRPSLQILVCEGNVFCEAVIIPGELFPCLVR